MKGVRNIYFYTFLTTCSVCLFYFGPTEVTVLSILASFSSGQVTHAHYIGSNLESFCQVSERIPIEILIRIAFY